MQAHTHTNTQCLFFKTDKTLNWQGVIKQIGFFGGRNTLMFELNSLSTAHIFCLSVYIATDGSPEEFREEIAKNKSGIHSWDMPYHEWMNQDKQGCFSDTISYWFQGLLYYSIYFFVEVKSTNIYQH